MDTARKTELGMRYMDKQWKEASMFNAAIQHVPVSERWSCVIVKQDLELFIQLAGNGAVLLTLYRRPGLHAVKEYITSEANILPERFPILSMIQAVGNKMMREAIS